MAVVFEAGGSLSNTMLQRRRSRTLRFVPAMILGDKDQACFGNEKGHRSALIQCVRTGTPVCPVY